MNNPIRHLLAKIGMLCIALVITAVLLLYYSSMLLKVHAPVADPDWIVVLGGDSGQRIFQTADLYNLFPDSRIFIAGGQECELIAERLILVGIPKDKIERECLSKTTYENALYTRNALRNYHPKRLLLVTSWYHTRRSLSVFRTLMPDIQIGTYAPDPEDKSFKRSQVIASSQLLVEYIKSLWYIFFY